MIKLVSVAEMRSIEHEADANGLTYDMMMQNAGRGLADVVDDLYGHLFKDGILGLIGSGNNGGDTLVALTHLALNGWKSIAYLVRSRDDQDPLIKQLLKVGGVVVQSGNDPDRTNLRRLLKAHAVLLDGVLGTGIQLPLRGGLSEILGFVKGQLQEFDAPPIVIAVDCPSGVDCDSGEAANETIPADITVTMAAIKQGLLKFPTHNLVGDIQLVDIGLPDGGEQLESWRSVRTYVVDPEWVRQVLPQRPLSAHKGTFGTALIIAGSANFIGAAYLAGAAAYRSGTGLVTLAVTEAVQVALAGHLTEATWLPLPNDSGYISPMAETVIQNNLDRVTGLLVGPGFGLDSATEEFTKRLLSMIDQRVQKGLAVPKLTVDADGLKLLAKIKNWSSKLPQESILTPHPGEMSVLTGLDVAEIQSDRLSIAQKFSQRWGHILVLKGAFTVIANPKGECAVIPVATPALARAGTGDVLAGLIIGLCAQGVSPYESAIAAAWIHAQAGIRAETLLGNSASVLASDVLNAIPDVISGLYLGNSRLKK